MFLAQLHIQKHLGGNCYGSINYWRQRKRKD